MWRRRGRATEHAPSLSSSFLSLPSLFFWLSSSPCQDRNCMTNHNRASVPGHSSNRRIWVHPCRLSTMMSNSRSHKSASASLLGSCSSGRGGAPAWLKGGEACMRIGVHGPWSISLLLASNMFRWAHLPWHSGAVPNLQ